MACVHEFGIFLDEDKLKEYIEYDPKRYHGMTVDDDIMSELLESLAGMKTYFHSYDRPEYGLAYCGITLIPEESLAVFREVVVSSDEFLQSDELQALAALIDKAARERKDLIHFGI
ncbi:short-chain dehydrogenase [Sporosarcina cyprini]|uniref:short-chain dehydrogenase n=1 Tax=Sporosarcina cyprini TaxID=2910523 RepID=UPI001EE025C9|nr:short-chain dehydrogenase [Sporosarcina cyprini]MCG3087323.1 short-chain dehydrogenase [Sporosarcina cyprini]